MGAFLDGMNYIGTILAKALLVKRFNEGWERQLPRFLIGVIELAEFHRIHAEFALENSFSVSNPSERIRASIVSAFERLGSLKIFAISRSRCSMILKTSR
jgi:hypothetical protein